MDSQFTFPIDVETFAAYLDGNLSATEMKEIELLIENCESLQQLVDANEAVDDTMEYFAFLNEELPEEIDSLDFEIPDLETIDDVIMTEFPSWNDTEAVFENKSGNDIFHEIMPEEEMEGIEDDSFDGIDFSNDDDIEF